MKKIALIGSGILSKEIAERAKELGVESHCFSFNDNDIACNSVDYFHKVNIFSIEEIVEICKAENINGVIPTTELTILPAAQISERLGLLGNEISVAKDITNKYITREKVKSVLGLHQPKYMLYTNGTYPTVSEFPVIVKPIAAGGKRGITVAYCQDEVEKAIVKALPYSKVEGVLIEEFLVGGSEYSVETLSYKSKHYVTQITEKDTSGPPHCNELGHHQPANLSNDLKQKVKVVISDMLDAVGITNGPSHTEIKIIDGQIYLIEINDRPGGDHITFPLTELSTGYPYLSGIIFASMGMLEGKEPINLKSYYAGIMFLTDKTPELEQIYEDCNKFSWFYKKNCVTKGLSKIEFNDEDGLNYFIYWDKKNDPMSTIRDYGKHK